MGGADELGENENFVTRVEQQRRSLVRVRGCLIAFLSKLEQVG